MIHKLDSRVKIISTMVFIVAIFMIKDLVWFGVAIAFLVALIFLTKIKFKVMLNGLNAIKYLLIFMTVINIFVIKTGEPVISIGFVTIYFDALIHTLFLVVRLVLLILYSSLLTLTTTPMELTDGIESLLKPFEKIKVPAHEIAMMISIALRFIPTLIEETDKIMKAQTSRGVEFSEGKLKDKVMAIVSLLIPLFVSAFKRADELANAMEARGYRGGEGRTKFRELKWGLNETLFLLMHFVLMFVILYRW
jgi:energy-coupling factor transport system permease protein